MENRVPLKLLSIFVVVLTLFSIANKAIAYRDNPHRLLTDEAVKFFNKNYPAFAIGDADKDSVVRGGVDEDYPNVDLRYLRHFYDPVNQFGFGALSTTWESSKNWSKDTIAQATVSLPNTLDASLYGNVKDWFSGADDYSWERAVYEYTWGDKKRGLEALGHILHLAEDLNVPEHTRNDSHPNFLEFWSLADGSPYEIYTDQFGIGSKNIADQLAGKNIKPIIKTSLDQYFIDEATFTNNNFFSKDTIDGYALPDINKLSPNMATLSNNDQKTFGYSSASGQEIKLVLINESIDFKTFKVIKSYSLEDNDDLILSDYWNILSKQAVMNGAGVIKLFFDSVEKEKQTKELYAKNRSVLGKAIDNFKNTVFSVANIFYGVSVTQQDLAEDVPVPATITSETPPAPTPTIKVAVTEPTLMPVVIPTPALVPQIETTLPQQTTEIIPSWYPRQAGSLSQDSPGGGRSFGGATSVVTTADTAAIATPTESASTTPAAVSDTTAPDVALTINECAASLSVGGCLLMNGNITANWSSTAADLQTYEFSIDGAILPLTSATSTSATTTLTDNSTHIISLRAQDTAGNWSASETRSIEISSRPVVVNEVAWAGTENGHPNDEWLELYNRTNQDVSLANWTLYSASQKPFINLANTIRAKSYFLLERGSDDVVSDVLADQIYGDGGGSWALNNSGEILTLARASTTIDQTVLCNNKWCPGSDYKYATMERKDPDTLGTDSANWDRNYYPSIIMNGKTASGGQIYGTPKARNSQNYFFNTSGTIASNLTLLKAKSPYVVASSITVSSGATLTIEPGVTIKFSGGGLTVNGTLNAQGTAESPIIFTTLTDDTSGGDTNGDGATTTPASGSWYGVALKQGSDVSRISNAVFRYAGLYYTGQDQHMANLYIENSSPSITNSIFEYSKIYGLKIQTSSSSIANNIIRNNNNATDPAGIDAGMYVSGGAPQISNNSFDINHRGLYFSGGSGTVSGNTFANHTREAIVLSSSLATPSNNSGVGNYFSGILLSGTTPSGTLTLSANALPYMPSGWTIAASSAVNVESGAIFKPQERIYVSGNFNLNGATPSDIIFTSPNDDSVGGDTLNDGAATVPRAGNWRGVVVKSGGTFTGTGFTMKYGGCVHNGCDLDGALTLENGGGTASVHGAIFESNYPFGIYSARGTIDVTDSIFQNHTPPVNAPGWGSAAFASYESTTTLTNVAFNNNKLGATGYVSIPWIVSGVSFLNNIKDMLPTNLF